MAKLSIQDSADNSGVRIPPPLIYIAVFCVGLFLQHLFPVAVFPGALRYVLSPVCLFLSGLLASSSFVSFWKSHTSPMPVKPTTALVMTGPYRFTRNPMYLSLVFLYIGVALWFNLFWPIVLLPLVIVAVRYYVIEREERYLERKFGQEYLSYKKRVRRWL